MSAVFQEKLVSIERAIPMRRVWAMPCKTTFDIAPIRALVRNYLQKSKASADPFARNKRWATYTNDLNPETAAEHHLPASEFLSNLLAEGIRLDLILFDPPYSRRQVIESYQSAGLHFAQQDSQYHSLNWPAERELMTKLLEPGGVVISCGWHSNGMNECGSNAGKYAIEEILLVAHSGAHHDTIVTVERKVESSQLSLMGD